MQLQVVTPLPADARAAWVRLAGRQFVDQTKLFLSTTRALLRRPHAFFADWAEGTHRSLSPLSYFAASLAVLGPVIGLFKYLGHMETPAPGAALLSLVAPYFEFVALGLLAHLALKAIARPQSWALSLAVALFAGGGPAALADTVAAAFSIWRYKGWVIEWLQVAGILAVNGVFVAVLVAGLSAVHRVRWWKPAIAWALAQFMWALMKVLFVVQVMT